MLDLRSGILAVSFLATAFVSGVAVLADITGAPNAKRLAILSGLMVVTLFVYGYLTNSG